MPLSSSTKAPKAVILVTMPLTSDADRHGLFNAFPRIVAELFYAESDFFALFVDGENDRFDFVAFFQHFGRMGDFFDPAQIGDVDQSIDARLEFDKSAVVGQVADFCCDAAADRIFFLDFFPRIFLGLLDAERDFPFLFLDGEDDRLPLHRLC